VVDHLNQYCANAHSPTQAREGNVHHGDPANRSLPMISHLGAMISNVLGLTDAQRRQGSAAVGFAIFGDGGSSTGDIHECLNLASLLSLPIVFVVENNRYAYSTPSHEQFSRGTELWKRAAAYGMEGFALDATSGDVGTIAATLAGLIDSVRRTSRPILIEASVVRLRGHAAYDTCDYLSASENQAIQSADPLPKFRDRLFVQGLRDPVESLERELDGFIEVCIQEALATPRPSPETLPADAFAPVAKPIAWQTEAPSATALTQAQALNAALRKILRERPESMILGQDIGTYGGAFKITEGLLNDFGRPRVLNTPLAESACTGYATGLALGGVRPIEEFQFADFATEATTQIALNAATYHFRSGAKVPLVLRLPCGGGLTFGSFHSQELESLFLSVPGLKALYPSTPQDAFDALLAAYEDDNPVLLFEHKGLYRKKKQLVTWNPDYRQVWKPKTPHQRDLRHAGHLWRNDAARRGGRQLLPVGVRPDHRRVGSPRPRSSAAGRHFRLRAADASTDRSPRRSPHPRVSAPSWCPGSPKRTFSTSKPLLSGFVHSICRSPLRLNWKAPTVPRLIR
jgi:2-oxoisovalerate dehydrogenase E1 component